MIKFFLNIIIISVGFLFELLVIRFGAIDTCLDRSGSFNYKSYVCEGVDGAIPFIASSIFYYILLSVTIGTILAFILRKTNKFLDSKATV